MVAITSDRIRAFWRWFLAHEEQLFAFDGELDTVFAEFADTLRRVHPGLCFEMGPVVEGRRELSISAGGCLDVFPAVNAVVALAPPLSRWQVREFRPPRPDCEIIGTPDLQITASDFRFDAEPRGDRLDLRLFYRGSALHDPETLEVAGFFLADIVVGEFDMEMFIGRVTTTPTASRRGRPLEELIPAVHAFKTDRATVPRSRAH